jgi:secondary thiamine-phosphate synthase enzyme
MESSLNHIVPENQAYYKHTLEGSDDMPAHVKSSLIGSSISIPITNGELALGTWQGIWLCEFRNQQHHRNVVVTINGE